MSALLVFIQKTMRVQIKLSVNNISVENMVDCKYRLSIGKKIINDI